MTRAAWCGWSWIDWPRLAAIASPASDLPYAVRVCADLEGCQGSHLPRGAPTPSIHSAGKIISAVSDYTLHSGTRARQARSLRSTCVASWWYLYPILYEAGTHFHPVSYSRMCTAQNGGVQRSPFALRSRAAARNTRAGVRTSPPMEVPSHDHRASSGHQLHAA